MCDAFPDVYAEVIKQWNSLLTRAWRGQSGRNLSISGGEPSRVAKNHLPHLLVAREQVGPTRVVERDQSYMVTCSTKR
jgi:hypothetical protein